MMTGIRREWLHRIGGYKPGIVRRPKRGAGTPGEEEPAWEDDPDGGVREAEADAAEGDAAEGNAAEGETAGEEGDRNEGGPIDPPPLSVPEEVEQARREREQKEAHGRQNLALAPQSFRLEGHYLRALSARFARMVSKVAEDSADFPTQGDEEWDLVELRQRRFTGRLVSQCRMTRERRKVAVVLDTSPSCEHQARLFAAVARAAEELGDCELFDAPNFVLHARRLERNWETMAQTELAWDFRRRVVVAFGDFDGIDRICAASAVKGNRIFWFSCEERPSVLEMNRETLLKKFKGHYFPATNIGSLMKAMRRVR